MKRVCPNCFNFVKKADQCPVCGYDFKLKKRKSDIASSNAGKASGKAEETQEERLNRLYAEAQAQDKAQESAEGKVGTNVNVGADNVKADDAPVDKFHQKNGRIRWVSKLEREGGKIKKEKVVSPRLTGVHIDVSEYEFFGRSKGKYNANKEKFVVNNNGKYEIEKLKWWEIYKWADRKLAKMKINKQVKKEAVKRPAGVSYWVLFFLCLFSGFIGIHNYYAGNYKRGIVSTVSFSMAMFFVAVLNNIAFFNTYMQGLLCAIPGLVFLFIWISDFLAIIFKKFKFRKSKEEYIKTLDLETRARLGKKYIYIV